MTYVDTTLTPAATYTYVHNGQIYDQIATTLAAHGNWQYVEYVDAVSAPNTYRRHVWKCKAAGSGLPSDFYVMFQTQFTTATGVYSQTAPVSLLLAEGYASGTLSKFASTEASITPASDLTNPATWALSTYAPPASAFFGNNSRYVTIGPTATSTSVRLLYIVAKDGIISNWGPNATTSITSAAGNPIYVGAYDSLLGSVADPMPIVIFGVQGSGSIPTGGCTRAPLQTPGVAVTEVFGVVHNSYPVQSSSPPVGNSSPYSGAGYGTLGSPGVTNWTKSVGGVSVFRGWLSSFTNSQNTNSAKALTRGYPKYLRNAYAAAHSVGDTFLVDGKVYLGLGSTSYGIWDTTAV